MRKEILMLAVLMMSAACTEISVPDKVNPGEGMTLYLSGEKPVIESDTKTYVDPITSKVLWSESGEKLMVAISNSAETQEEPYDKGVLVPKRELDYPLESNEATVTNGGLEATFSLTEKDDCKFPIGYGDYRFHAVYPADAAFALGNEHLWDWGVWVGTRQNEIGQFPTETCYDPAADVMLAISKNKYSTITSGMNIDLIFERLVTHGKITLTGLPTNAIVSKAIIKAPIGYTMSGIYYINVLNKDLSCDKSNRNYVILNYTPYSEDAGEKETKSSEGTGRQVNSDGTFDLWFCTQPINIPQGDKLQIMLYTTEGTIEKTITANDKGISFEKNKLSTLSINMSAQTQNSYYMQIMESPEGDTIEKLSLSRQAGSSTFYIKTNAGNVLNFDYSAIPSIRKIDVQETPMVYDDGSLLFTCNLIRKENNSINTPVQEDIPMNFIFNDQILYSSNITYSQDCGKGEIYNETDDWTADPVTLGSLKWYPVNCGFDKKHPYGKYFQFGRYAGQYPYCDDSKTKFAIPSFDSNFNFIGTPDDDTFYGYYNNWYDLTTMGPDWSEEDHSKGKGNPCPEGWRLPTNAEWNNLVNNYSRSLKYTSYHAGASFDGITSDNKAIIWYIGNDENPLEIPLCGSIKAQVLDETGKVKDSSYDFSTLNNIALERYGCSYNYGRYWAYDQYYYGGSAMVFVDSYTMPSRQDVDMGQGCSVRCVQDIATE